MTTPLNFAAIMARADAAAAADQREIHKLVRGAPRADGEITNPPAPPYTTQPLKTTCSKCGVEITECPHCAAMGTPPSIDPTPPSRGDGAGETLFDRIRRDTETFRQSADLGFAYRLDAASGEVVQRSPKTDDGAPPSSPAGDPTSALNRTRRDAERYHATTHLGFSERVER